MKILLSIIVLFLNINTRIEYELEKKATEYILKEKTLELQKKYVVIKRGVAGQSNLSNLCFKDYSDAKFPNTEFSDMDEGSYEYLPFHFNNENLRLRKKKSFWQSLFYSKKRFVYLTTFSQKAYFPDRSIVVVKLRYFRYAEYYYVEFDSNQNILRYCSTLEAY